MVACAAYTSGAELYVQKHMARKEIRSDMIKEAAEDWLASDEGHGLWRSEVKRLLSESKESGKRLTRLELEYRARQALLKAKMESLKKLDTENPDSDENNPNGEPMNAKTGGFIDRAEESLLRVWEIHESAFGRNHPSTASSCLSLGNLCVITRDLPQAKLWFDSAKNILDICYHNKCMQVTAATETQLGHVYSKLDLKEEAAIHLMRAADFHLNQSKLCRNLIATSEGPAMSCLDIAENRRKFWSAKQANHLYSEAAGHWISMATNVAIESSPADPSTHFKNEKKFAKQAILSQEKSVSAIGLMYGNGETTLSSTTEGSKLLMQGLKLLGTAYEVYGDFRKATDAYAKQKSIALRVLGPNNKSTKTAIQRHKKAASKAAKQRPMARPLSPGGSRVIGSGAAGAGSRSASPSPSSSPLRKSGVSLLAETMGRKSPPDSPVEFGGDESWLR